MEQIYDSTHSGQEVDRAAEAALTTIPAQLTQIGSNLNELESKVAFIGDDNVLIGSVVRTDSSGNRQEKKFDIVAGTEYTVTSSNNSSDTAYFKFYDANDTQIGSQYSVSPGNSLTQVAPDNAVGLGIFSYRAINVDITTPGKIRLLKKEIDQDLANVDSKVSQLGDKVTNLASAPIAFSESDTFTSEFYAIEGDVVIVDITAISGSYSLFTDGFSSDGYAIVNSIGKIEITALHNGYLRFYKRSSEGTIEGSLALKSYFSEQIDSLNKNIAELNEITTANLNDLSLWEMGYYGSDGGKKSSNNRIRTKSYINENVANIDCENLTYYLVGWDANGTFVGFWNREEFTSGYALSGSTSLNDIRLNYPNYKFAIYTVSSDINDSLEFLFENVIFNNINTTNKKIKSFISSIEQASATPFTITVSDSGISVTPKGYVNGENLGNLSPISTSFGDKSIIVLKYYNSILSCEAVNNLNDQAGIIAIAVKSSRGIFIPYCANGVSIITENANIVNGFTQYYNSCVHASQTDFSWSPLLHAVMRVESSDTTKEVLLRSIKRGGSNYGGVYDSYINVMLTCAGEDITIWCTPTLNDTYEGERVTQDATYKVVVNKTMADYICPIDNTAVWKWKVLGTPAPVTVVPYGIYDTRLETDTHIFPGYIKDSEDLYKKDALISQMIPMTQLMVNHETIGTSIGTHASSYYDRLYGEVYNPDAKSGYGFRIVWGKIAFDGTTYDFSSTIDSTRYPRTVASEFLKAYRNKSKICFRFSMFSGEENDAYIKKPSSIPQVLQDWISENGYSWDNSDILVDSNSEEVRIGCPVSVLVSMLDEGKAPVYYSTDSGSGIGWYFDFTSDALYTAYMDLHAQFSTWLDSPLLDENGEAVTSTFYGVTKSIKYRDVLSELQFGLGIYSEGSIKHTPTYDSYPFSNLKRYYTKVLELFPNEMIFFGNAMFVDIDHYFTSEEMFEIWTMTNNRGRVGIFCDAIGVNGALRWAKKLEGKFPFSGEGYQSANYDIESYFDAARYFNVHSYHLSNFALPGGTENKHTTISSAALRAFNIMVRLFGPHLWYQYLGGSSSLGWVEFTIENIGLHYLFDTGRKLYLILRSNPLNEVVYIADITSVCDVTSLVPKDWKNVGVPSSQNKYMASFPAINNCSMYLTLVDPNGFQEPFWFNNNGRNEFGEYPLAPFVN